METEEKLKDRIRIVHEKISKCTLFEIDYPIWEMIFSIEYSYSYPY
jgi:hypothetical protein